MGKREQPSAPSTAENVLRLMHDDCPGEVAKTLRWLGTEGWRAFDGAGGPPEWEGNAGLFVRFEKGGWQVDVTRDRGQWTLDLLPDGWKEPTGLSLIPGFPAPRDVGAPRHANPYAGQLPAGMPWAEALPLALDWIAQTPGAEGIVRAARKGRLAREKIQRRGERHGARKDERERAGGGTLADARPFQTTHKTYQSGRTY